MKNKEKIYDEKISPFVGEIIKICKKEKIPMFAEFQFSHYGYCMSCIPNKENKIFQIYQAVSQSKSGENINIDKLLMWFIKHFDVRQSCYLHEHNINAPTDN